MLSAKGSTTTEYHLQGLSAQETEKRLYELIKKEIKDFANLSEWFELTLWEEKKKSCCYTVC